MRITALFRKQIRQSEMSSFIKKKPETQKTAFELAPKLILGHLQSQACSFLALLVLWIDPLPPLRETKDLHLFITEALRNSLY